MDHHRKAIVIYSPLIVQINFCNLSHSILHLFEIVISILLANLSCSGTSSFYSNTPVVFKVQAKDILGNIISSGGDKFVIEIKNECTMDA